MHKLFTIATLISSLAATGCASITGSKTQPLSVQTVLENKEIAGIGCVLTNDAGKWFVTTPGSVTVQKSTADLVVDCKNEGLSAAGQEVAVSKANGGAWGNILIGGPIGYVVDRSSGAGFDYPQTITVVLKKIDQLLSAKPSTAQAD